MCTCSTNERMSSTELLEAASSSNTLNEAELLKDWHDSHALQGSNVSVRCRQLSALAKMRAQVVFPTPRGPQNKKACATWPVRIAFFNVEVMASCPTTELKVVGLYLRADTIKLSIVVLLLLLCLNERQIYKKRKHDTMAHIYTYGYRMEQNLEFGI